MSVTKIVKSLAKTIKKLEAHADAMDAKIQSNDQKIRELTNENTVNNGEYTKARRIAGKIKGLIE